MKMVENIWLLNMLRAAFHGDVNSRTLDVFFKHPEFVLPKNYFNRSDITKNPEQLEDKIPITLDQSKQFIQAIQDKKINGKLIELFLACPRVVLPGEILERLVRSAGFGRDAYLFRVFKNQVQVEPDFQAEIFTHCLHEELLANEAWQKLDDLDLEPLGIGYLMVYAINHPEEQLEHSIEALGSCNNSSSGYYHPYLHADHTGCMRELSFSSTEYIKNQERHYLVCKKGTVPSLATINLAA